MLDIPNGHLHQVMNQFFLPIEKAEFLKLEGNNFQKQIRLTVNT